MICAHPVGFSTEPTGVQNIGFSFTTNDIIINIRRHPERKATDSNLLKASIAIAILISE